jgi:hypothetical protein
MRREKAIKKLTNEARWSSVHEEIEEIEEREEIEGREEREERG